MQAELPPIPRRGKAHNYDYARWEDINEAIKPVLTKHNWGLHFETINESDIGIEIKAILTHITGHIRTNSKKLPLDKSGVKSIVQAFGSTQSYAQRYAAIPLLNIVSYGEDDDGVAAGGRKNPHVNRPEDFGDVPPAEHPDRIPNGAADIKPLPKKDARQDYNKLYAEMTLCATPEKLKAWAQANKDRIA